MQLFTQHTGVQVFKTVVGELMFSFGICHMVGGCLDVAGERTCVHLQSDMDAAVQCYTDLSSADALEKYPAHSYSHYRVAQKNVYTLYSSISLE